MKFIAFVATILFASLFSNCSKSDVVTHVNCDGLVTDTAGSGDNGRVYMPNSFTPNGDGLNDIGRPVLVNIDSVKFTVYDDNNTVLFTTDQVGQGFSPVPNSNPIVKYYYRVQATTFGHKKIGLCGEFYSLSCYTINPPKTFYTFEDMFNGSGFTSPTAETLTTCR